MTGRRVVPPVEELHVALKQAGWWRKAYAGVGDNRRRDGGVYVER